MNRLQMSRMIWLFVLAGGVTPVWSQTGLEPVGSELPLDNATVKVIVEAERSTGSGRIKVTEAEVVYVHVDRNNQPVPIEEAKAAAKA